MIMEKILFHAAFLMLSLSVSSCCSGTDCVQECGSVKETVVENIMTRRSVRKYKDTPVDSVAMREILMCGIHAPNGQARESWEIRVIDSREMLDRIDAAYEEYVSGAGASGHSGNGNGTGAANARRNMHRATFGAPVLVFIAYDTTYDLSQVDCGLLGGNMMLAAHSMGIGSCCLGGLCRFVNSEYATDILGMLDLPPAHRLLYAIAFGYPDEKPVPKTRDWGKVKYVR